MLSLSWMHLSGSNPTARDNMLDSIGVWIYQHLIVECLHVASLPSLESAVLTDSLSVENIYIGYSSVFTCFCLG